jgi:ATP-dependent helicase/DNAse subunit B
MGCVPITLITGPANAGKAELVMEAVRRHRAHGSEPLLVLPTRADADHYLRELAADGVALGVRVERFEGLLALVVARAGAGGAVLDGLARERLIAHVLAAGASAAEPAPGVVRALADAIAELRQRRVSPARLDAALAAAPAAPDAGRRAEGVDGAASEPVLRRLCGLYASYAAELRRLGRMDREERHTRALDELRRRPAAWGGQPVLVYGFDDLTPLQLDAIETLGRVVDAEVTIALAYEPGRVAFAGRAAAVHALAPLAAEHRELGARAEHYSPPAREALSHLERSLFESDPARVDPAEAVRLLEGGGERAELELVAEEARRLLDGGMPAEEVAIVLRAGPARAALLEEVLAAAGVPFALERRRPFGHTATGGALLAMLRCAQPGEGAGAGDLLAWLRAPGVLTRLELADRLELDLRRAGIVDGAAARKRWEQRNWELDALARVADAAARSPVALIDRAGTELERLFSAPRRRAANVLGAVELDEARALAAGRLALAQLRELARIDPAFAPAAPAQLADVLERVDVVCGAVPEPGLVAVLDPLGLRARRVRALFVCCLQEGTFPAPARPRPFLSDDERRALAERGLRLGEPEDALAAERYLLYAAVSRPQERLYLSWHLTGDDGEPKTRSLFVDDVCDLFAERLAGDRACRALGALPAAPAGAAVAAEDVTVPRGGEAPPGRPAGIAPLEDELLLRELGERPWSASSLERWIACPARWFVERLLGPQDFDPDAEQLARGGLAHIVLRDVLEGLRAQGGSARLDATRLPLARSLLDRALVEHEAARPLSASPERRLAARRRLEADLTRYLEHVAGEASPLEPAELELGFGFEGDDPGAGEGAAAARANGADHPGGAVGGAELPAFDLGDGARLRGRIDRVDRTADGEAVVYDYKYRDVPKPGRWVAEGDVQVALYMRVVEQLLDVRVAGGLYQPLSGEDLRARGLVDIGSQAADCAGVRGDARERPEVDAIVAEAVTLARVAAGQAARGEVEPRPATCGWRGSGCEYPSICRCRP